MSHYTVLRLLTDYKEHHFKSALCSTRKYPSSPHRRDWNFLGGGVSLRPKNLKECMKFNWNFQRGGGVLEKIPSVGEVWIFSGTTQCSRWNPQTKLLGKKNNIPVHVQMEFFFFIKCQSQTLARGNVVHFTVRLTIRTTCSLEKNQNYS